MITIISGTNRENNNSIKISRHVAGIYKELGEPVELLDLRDLPAEAFLPGVFTEKPESLTSNFTDKILSSDGLVVVVPEYNGSFPGVLKHFVDLLPFPESFNCRPVAFIGLAAGYHGALRPVEQLQMVFAYRNAHLFNRRVFIPSVHKVLAEDGSVSDTDLKSRLEEQSRHFVQFIQALKPSA
ncbi:NAD(P)H-dependent oxidoreductase [Puniceicoccales bacterium CK1056]|uniref:NAD(P)H-dependent oxidoreductase n=1 Tax=Oceanipulchritudo coccoides TaxID=2706888 RepID=A0A6B2M1S8_9BACT|nr:NADPH-dependent FMN reductase [Oceanipulchritudo coccoides]NDV62094.1 NAD(P)H-dependent oxidoreductase [Oceanipulchritudo coccoides]